MNKDAAERVSLAVVPKLLTGVLPPARVVAALLALVARVLPVSVEGCVAVHRGGS